ncbi:DUF371 domain-containing protein [Candidatus Bathyarchaeota archaeon]|nr:DUF371 domain-containing protein [Candidatus Bathyarchaeota archaeon]
MKICEIIFARGHENIESTHRSTIEVTKARHISGKANCIIAVSAEKAVKDLSLEFKKSLCRESARLSMLIEAEEVNDVIFARGDPRLVLTNLSDMVVRKSGYICNRTLAIQADKAACDLSRKLVERLKNPRQKVKVTLTVV